MLYQNEGSTRGLRTFVAWVDEGMSGKQRCAMPVWFTLKSKHFEMITGLGVRLLMSEREMSLLTDERHEDTCPVIPDKKVKETRLGGFRSPLLWQIPQLHSKQYSSP